VSMDGTVTPPVAPDSSQQPLGQTQIRWNQPFSFKRILRKYRRKPVAQAVTVFAVILIIGLILASLSGPKPKTYKSPNNSGSTPSVPSDSLPAIEANQTVYGVDLNASVVQIIVLQDGESCWTGSGTIFVSANYVLTNNHIIESDESCSIDEIEILTISSVDQPPIKTHVASVVATDVDADLAILKITPIGNFVRVMKPVPVASTVTIGDDLIAVGFPGIGGESVTVTKGEVAGFTNYLGVRYIKTSVSISGGNSGGGAFNKEGQLIGVPSFLGAADAKKSTDCRPNEDTNGDGTLDDRDQCVSMGGFINSLSPASRATDLAKTYGLVVTP